MKKNTKTVTFHSAINHGAILQTIALQKFLNNIGYYNEVINYTDKCMYQYNPFNVKGLPIKIKIKKIIKSCLFDLKSEKRYIKFNKFIKEHILLTDKINKPENMLDVIDYDDILITGSDQVWNTDFFGKTSDFYMLKYSNKTNKKISYAASIGKDKIEEKYLDEFRENLNEFEKISIRESTAQMELKKLLNRSDIEVVLDPTLLLTKKEWEKEISNDIVKLNKKYIVAYTMELNDEYLKIVNELSEKTGLKVIYFDYRNFGFKNVLKNGYTYNPYEFLNVIRNAEYIVTNSFHGAVFSIIFNKKFWTIPHSTRGIRMIDLLNKLQLSERIVYNYDEFKNREIDEEIDFESVNKLLENERNKSINWLKKAIEDV